jgi:hypothetical protein
MLFATCSKYEKTHLLSKKLKDIQLLGEIFHMINWMKTEYRKIGNLSFLERYAIAKDILEMFGFNVS